MNNADERVKDPRFDHFVLLMAIERNGQDSQWGGPSHDDSHDVATWLAILTKHLGRLAAVGLDRDFYPSRRDFNHRLRHRLVALASLCAAWSESIDRQQKEER